MYLFYRPRRNYWGIAMMTFFAGLFTGVIIGPGIKKGLREKARFYELKRKILDRTSAASDLSREKYEAIVDEVMENYAKVKGISQNELKDLAADLKFHWYRIRNAWKSDNNLNVGSV